MVSTMLSSGPKLVEAAEGVERVHRDGKRVFAETYKQSLVERCLQPGTSVSRVALEHGINANLHRQASAEVERSGDIGARHDRSGHQQGAARCDCGAVERATVGRRHRDRDWESSSSPARRGRRAAPGGRARGLGGALVIGLPSGTRVWIAAGHTDMRKGFNGLAALVQSALAESPYSGHVFVFRGRRGDILKVLWFDGQGLMLLAKRLERGRFVWPQATTGSVSLTPAQLSMLLEGIDWRMPARTWQPEMVI